MIELPRPKYYALIERKVVPIMDLMQWARWYEAARASDATRIGRDTVNGILVSTIFLALDHGFKPWDGPEPVLFETMVFPEEYDPKDSSSGAGDRMYRYHTIEEAEAGHKAVVAALQEEHIAVGAELRAIFDRVREKVFGGV